MRGIQAIAILQHVQQATRLPLTLQHYQYPLQVSTLGLFPKVELLLKWAIRYQVVVWVDIREILRLPLLQILKSHLLQVLVSLLRLLFLIQHRHSQTKQFMSGSNQRLRLFTVEISRMPGEVQQPKMLQWRVLLIIVRLMQAHAGNTSAM